jgi:hypothetical protein
MERVIVFNSPIFDVALGLVFCFASVALFVSSIVESIAALLKLRHKSLLTGIRDLLNNTDFVHALYQHALINPLHSSSGGAIPSAQPTGAQMSQNVEFPKKPAYIPSDQFAHALTDLIAGVPGNINALNTQITQIQNLQLKALFQGFAQRSRGDIKEFETQIARWFDNAMDRLSGGYKRMTQLLTFIVAFAFALVLNIDSILIFTTLWQRPALAASVTSPNSEKLIQSYLQSHNASSVSPPEKNSGNQNGRKDANRKAIAGVGKDSDEQLTSDMVSRMMTLPVGWSLAERAKIGEWTFSSNRQAWITPQYPPLLKLAWPHIPGCLITASAALFGAPFWFDLLQRLIQIRGTGTKPLTGRERSLPDVKPTRTP